MTFNEALVRRGLTPDTLAAAMDVPRETVVSWLCHRRRMHRRHYKDLRRILGVSHTEFRDLLPELKRKI